MKVRMIDCVFRNKVEDLFCRLEFRIFRATQNQLWETAQQTITHLAIDSGEPLDPFGIIIFTDRLVRTAGSGCPQAECIV